MYIENVLKKILKFINLKYVVFIYDLYILIFHIFLHFIFTNEDILFLKVINLVSILNYFILYIFFKKQKFKIVYFMTIFEIVTFAFITTIFLGNNLLFYTYNVAIIPIMSLYLYYNICIENKKNNIYKITIFIFLLSSILFFMEFIYLGNNNYYIISNESSKMLFFLNSLNIISTIIFNSILFLTIAITIYKEYEKNIKDLSYLAMYDALTKLPNRNALNNEIQILKEKNINYCVIIADIDDFKQINDSYGHDCGDYVLKEISNILSTYSSKNIKIFRYGGEEILFISSNNYDIEKYFNKIRKTIQNYNFHYNKKIINVSMTFGISNMLNDFDTMLKNADEKLYKGKKNGKNVVVF